MLDDRQVVAIHAVKQFGAVPSVKVVVVPLSMARADALLKDAAA